MVNFQITEIIFSIFLILIPVIIASIPYLLYTRRKEEKFWTILYNRMFMGFIAFYFMYFIFADILNSFVQNPDFYLQNEFYSSNPSGSSYSNVWQADMVISMGLISIPIPLLFKYMFQFTVNSYMLFFQYPIMLLAFVFVISPIISFLIAVYQIRKQVKTEQKPLKILMKQNKCEIKKLEKKLKKMKTEDSTDIISTITSLKEDQLDLKKQLGEVATFSDRLQDIQYELEDNPFKSIIDRAKAKDWGNEKELLKILIAILPITLFLLMTILKVLGEEENASLLQGTTVGWFLEIFFAYTATFVFAIYLLKSSKISRKGKYLGEQLYLSMIQSLMTVGLFMSFLAVALFLIEYPQQLSTISYFVVYFVMVSIFFVVFLDIFEPFSTYLLVKFLESSKKVKKSISRISVINSMKISITGIITAFLLGAGYWVFYNILYGIFENFETLPYLNAFWLFQNFSVYLIAAALIVFSKRWNWSAIGNAVILYFSIYFVSYFLNFAIDTDLWINIGLPRIFPPFVSAFPESEINWLSSVFKLGEYGGMYFIVPELYPIPVLWQTEGLISASTFLSTASLPYNILHPLAIITLYGTMFFFIRKPFKSKTIEGEDRIRHRNVYSPISNLPSKQELRQKEDIIYIQLKSDIQAEKYDKMKNYFDEKDIDPTFFLSPIKEEMITFKEFRQHVEFSIEDIHDLLDEIIYSFGDGSVTTFFDFYYNEYSYSFIEVTIDSLHVMMLDGRACLSHELVMESQVEPALVAGLFSAITSFAKEAVRSEQLLRTIDHGDVVLTIEYGKWVFAATFADRTTTELRKKLVDFLTRFEKKHQKDLPAWLGDMDVFNDDMALVNEIFVPE